MVSRHTFLVMGLMAAGGAPYLSSKAGFQEGTSSVSSAPQAETAPFTPSYQPASAEGYTSKVAATGNPFGGSTTASVERGRAQGHSIQLASSSQSGRDTPATEAEKKSEDTSKTIRFEDVFRLDINSAWLMTHWPRVTTGLAELDLHGYRVALLTGTKEDDLAGALTYYYDKKQVIQKMTFRGRTGDPRRLVHFATSQYNLVQVTVDDPALQVFRTKGLGKKASELIVRPAQVIRADAPRERFDVEFTLYR